MVERRLALPDAARGPEIGPGSELLGREPFRFLTAEGSAAPRPEPEGAAKPAAPKAEGPALDKDGEEIVPLPIPIARLVPRLKKSAKLFEEGKKYIPNATSSLIRVASYDPCPPFIAKGKGTKIWDVDGNEYLDFNLAYGCLINGHAHPEMVKALSAQAELGFHFASPTELEIDVAKAFRRMVPNSERIAFCSNGSDATMNAIRIARAVTGKDAILKFEGHYHGQHDYALISAEAPPIVAGLDEYPRPLPNSAGIPPGVTDYVMVAPFNSIPALERMVRRYRDRLACVILEPIMANAGIIPPAPDYLQRLREITRENDL
ncbi:MAG: aminotransferase class III-fold pyridoxal phosphate-dependent enzyme, partial [Thermoplasmata archaeon]|nr:aminotransferase class III-fold pyridoxal phosphate-dependent enzyme [Thermoplasmata archaeon]